MKSNADRFYFMVTGNSGTHIANGWNVADTGWKWWPAIAYDIGAPDSAGWLYIDTTDGAAQTAKIWRRDFTKSDGTDVMMLYRGMPEDAGTDYSATSAIKVGLGGNYQVINADSSLGSVIDSVDVRHVEGVMLLGEETISQTEVKGVNLSGVIIQ